MIKNSELNAQSFISNVSPSSYTFGTGEETRWNNLSTKPYYSWSGLASFGNLSNLVSENGSLAFDFPNDDCGTIEFTPKRVEYVSENQYTWYGELGENNPCGCCAGYLLLISENGRKFGDATIGDRVYDIQSLSNGLSMIFEVAENRLDSGVCVTGPESGQPASNLTLESSTSLNTAVTDRTNPCNIVRVGVMATHNIDCDGNELAKKAIIQLNTALSNSLVPAASLRFEKAGFQYLPITFNETNNPNLNRDFFAASKEAINFRESSEADILVFLTDGSYGTTTGTTPSTNVGNPQSAFSYCLVQADAAITEKTFAHEVGHVMGGDHACSDNAGVGHLIPCVGDGSSNMHGFIFTTNPSNPNCSCRKERYTIMGRGAKAHKRRILNFSNPLVTIPTGAVTGDADSDMATWLSGVACQVSEYFPSPTTLTASIDAPDEVYNANFSVTANVLGGTSPYVYDWAYSSDGANYTNLSSTTSTVSIPNSWYTETGINYVRLRVTDADNEQEWAYAQVKSIPLFNGSGNDKKSANDACSVFPNPAFDFLDILPFVGLQNEPVEVWLVNERGQICKSTRFQFIGEKQQIDLKGLITGKYTVHCMSRTTSFSKQVIVARP